MVQGVSDKKFAGQILSASPPHVRQAVQSAGSSIIQQQSSKE